MQYRSYHTALSTIYSSRNQDLIWRRRVPIKMQSEDRGRPINFSAGPSALPLSVLKTMQEELTDYQLKNGLSVMEMSHRSPLFTQTILEPFVSNVRTLLSLDKAEQSTGHQYHLLLMQGGGTMQFSAWIMNCIRPVFSKNKLDDIPCTVDYAVTGSWSQKAYDEGKRYLGNLANICVSTKESGHRGISSSDIEWKWSNKTHSSKKSKRFVYYCSNETINGVEFPANKSPLSLESADCPYTRPECTDEVYLIADMSSNIMSRPIENINEHALIFAGAQKNMGIAGLTLVIVRDDLLNIQWNQDLSCDFIPPSAINYQLFKSNNSLYHTPPVFAIYSAKLITDWLVEEKYVNEEKELELPDGSSSLTGLDLMRYRNHKKSELLYDYLDNHHKKDEFRLWRSMVSDTDFRSKMTVPLRIIDSSMKDIKYSERLEAKFLDYAKECGLLGLKGHRSVGGLRVALYNSIPYGAVCDLIEHMESFRNDVKARKIKFD